MAKNENVAEIFGSMRKVETPKKPIQTTEQNTVLNKQEQPKKEQVLNKVEISPDTEQNIKEGISDRVEVKKEEKKPSKAQKKDTNKPAQTADIHIRVSEEDMEMINIAKAMHGNNVSQYIKSLIKKDLEKNDAKYKAILKIIKS